MGASRTGVLICSEETGFQSKARYWGLGCFAVAHGDVLCLSGCSALSGAALQQRTAPCCASSAWLLCCSALGRAVSPLLQATAQCCSYLAVAHSAEL